MKKNYISPAAVQVKMNQESPLCFQSNNETHTGTGQEGVGEGTGETPGTGDKPTDPPEEGERNAKKAYIWDEW